MGRIGCRRVLQMWDHELHTWKALNHKLARVRGLTNESLHFVQSFIRKLEHDTVDEQDASLTPGHWRWSDQNTERMEAFILPNRQAYLFLFPQDFTHQRLNSIWEVTLEEGEWQTFWHALWQSNLTTTAKVFLWRILAQGLFTGSRAITIKIGDGRCLACPGIVKTIPHLFATCPYARSIWQQCWPFLYGRGLSSTIHPNLFQMIKDQLHHNPASIARLFLLYQSTWHLWLGRNALLFNNKPRSFIMDLVLAEASLLLTSVTSSLPPGIQNTRVKQAREEVDRWQFPHQNAALS
jgi:hypothetical protein